MINIAICDDCESDLQQLKEMIEEIMETYAVSHNILKYDSGKKLLDSVYLFQLVFLDIMLDGENGIDIGQQIYKKNRFAKIIFQTNFGQYCKAATNQCHAFAFLEKPLQKSMLEKQIKEFLENREGKDVIEIEFSNVMRIISGKLEENPLVRIPVSELIYFEYQKSQKQIKIVTERENYIYSDTMSNLEQRMKGLGFEICCRGILVNIDKVKKIKGYKIFLKTGETIPLSQRRVARFKERINEYIHNSFE